jgi:hypothetical protein
MISQTLEEVDRQYHISPATILASPRVSVAGDWVLRIDVESLALRLYGTRAFHNAHIEQFGKPCSICAITRFISEHQGAKPRFGQKNERRPGSSKKKAKRSSKP